MSNGTYDNDPSRSPRFMHGSGALSGMVVGLLIWGSIIGALFGLEWLLHPIAAAWFGWR